MPQEKIFAELKDQNVFRQPPPMTIPDHMRDKTKFSMLHNKYSHILSTCRNLYGQLKAMMRKGYLLRYLKKKIPFGSYKKPWEEEKLSLKVVGEGSSKEAEAGTSGQNLRIVSFVGRGNEEKEAKYSKYANRREERNLKTQALGRYLFGISTIESSRVRASAPITFTNEDLEGINLPQSDPLVIKLRIGDSIVSRVLVDKGSSSDIIFWSALRRMRVDESLIRSVKTQISTFDGSKVNPIGTITLPVYVAEQILMITFFIVDTPNTINAIMGCEWIHSIQGVVSTLHQLIRCSSPDGQYTIDIKGDSMKKRRCFNVESIGKIKRLCQEHLNHAEEKKAKAIEEDAENFNK